MQFLVDSPTPPRSHPAASSPRHHPYHHHSHFTTSNNSPTAPAPAPAPPTPQPHQHQHHIPFPQPPGSQPGSLGFGFGLSSASNLNSTISWGGGANSRSPAQQQQQQQPSSPLSGSRRRRRSASEGEGEEDETMEERQEMRMGRGGLKKARRMGAGAEEGAAQSGSRMGKNEQDLGTALASLSKPSLLTLLHSLLTSQPSLTPLVTSLLPPPTLPSTLTSLQSLERAVLHALPTGARTQLREEYIWGRVRVPLEEYVAEAKSWLGAFLNPPPGQLGGGAGAGEEDLHHPSTTFAFLYQLTSSLRRLEVALPLSSPSSSSSNPLSSHLLPLTLNSWHIFLTRLSTSVNQEGRIISKGMLRGWFERLEELCVASPGVGGGEGEGRGEGPAKRQCEGVRERMRKEVGWLVGMRPGGGAGRGSREQSVQGMMEEEEEL